MLGNEGVARTKTGDITWCDMSQHYAGENMHEILVFKGFCGSYVWLSNYEGGLPPELQHIEIENELYRLTIIHLDEKEYLVAHNDSLLPDVTHHAIISHNLKPIQR